MKTEPMEEVDSEDEAENEKFDQELQYISSRLEEIRHELNELQSRQVLFSKKSSESNLYKVRPVPNEGRWCRSAQENVKVGAKNQANRKNAGFLWAQQL